MVGAPIVLHRWSITTGVIAGLDPVVSGSILVDAVHGVDSSAF
jgi:hypothetical protein